MRHITGITRTLVPGFVVTLLVATALTLVPGAASAKVNAPGSFTGYGFDACTAPSQYSMDKWRTTSPYSAVGIYISGTSRGCSQPNLTKTWVKTQAARGWRLLPLHVGYQAPCYSKSNKHKMSSNPTTARKQGIAAANESVAAARRLGIGAKKFLYLDMEYYNPSNKSCNNAVLAFVDGWTARLHAYHYKSGFYSSAAGGIAALNKRRSLPTHGYHFPDQLWIGWYNGRANTAGGSYLSSRYWATHDRVHQYLGGHKARYGGVTINIDNNFLDVGKGSKAPAASGQCHTPKLSKYTKQRQGKKNDQVYALKCLLKKKHFYKGKTTRYFGRKVTHAVVRFQKERKIPATGVVNRRTWVALLSYGTKPLMKYGVAKQSVRRLQRSLTAATKKHVPMTGIVDSRTVSGIRKYRKMRHLSVYSVAETATWTNLQQGRH